MKVYQLRYFSSKYIKYTIYTHFINQIFNVVSVLELQASYVATLT